MGSKRQPGNTRSKGYLDRRTRSHLQKKTGQFETLEARMLLAVDFVPAPLGGFAVNRTDQPLGIGDSITQPAIALDENNPGVIAIANEDYLLVSSDAGTTFADENSFQGALGASKTALGSSALVYTTSGELKWSNVIQDGALQTVGVTFANDNIAGVTQVPISAGDQVVRPVIVSDTNVQSTSPYAGNLYIAFTDESTNQVMLSTSTDGGLVWNAPVTVSEEIEPTTGNLPPVSRADVSVASNGDVYVAYHYQSGVTPPSGPDNASNADGQSGQIIVRRSIDGGQTFLAKTTPFAPGGADISLNVQTISGAVPNARFSFQGARQPTVLADPSREGHIYVIANDDPDDLHGEGDEGDIVFASSTDFGQTWATKTIASNRALQVMPTATIDRFGNIVLAWYDARRGNVMGDQDYRLDVFASYSTDGGSTWADEFRINDDFNPTDPVTEATEVLYVGADRNNDGRPENDGDETYSLGDYFDVSTFGGTAYVVWNGNERVLSLPAAHQVFFDLFPIYGTLQVTGLDTNDQFLVRAMPTNADFVEVFVNGQRQYVGLLESLTGGIQVDGLIGNDTLVVDYGTGDPVPPGGIFFDGNIPEGDGIGDTLDILPPADATIEFQANPNETDAGRFVIGNTSAISFDHIERTQIGSTDYLRPDLFETNEGIDTATVLGSEPTVTLRNLTIHDLGNSTSSVDFYRVTANQTGTLIINSLFRHADGDLDLFVHDDNGVVIATSSSLTDHERLVIPVVAQESYFVQILGVDGAMNKYALELENFAAPAPQAVHLANEDDTGMMNDDAKTAETEPRFVIQADLDALRAQGITILTAAEATRGLTPGAAVYVSITNTVTGQVVAGFADAVIAGDDLFEFEAPSLPSGDYIVSAATQIFDLQTRIEVDEIIPAPATGRTILSETFEVRIDAQPPEIVGPQLLPSSDSGMSRLDRVTNIMSPAFTGVTEPNAKVRVLANGLIVGQSVAGSDGRWEVTVEPLTDGIYEMTVQAEDLSGNFSESSTVNRIEIDTIAPNTPYLDLVDASDTGTDSNDDMTGDATLTFTMTSSDTNSEDHLSPFNFKYRLYVRPEGGQERLVYDSVGDSTIPAENRNGAFTNLALLTRTLDALPEGTHNFKLEVEDRGGNISEDFLLPVKIDTTLPTAITLSLHPDSDSGMLNSDNVTKFSRPTLTGVGNVGSIVSIFAGERLVGMGIVGSDITDGQVGNGIGAWQITTGSLDDGVYSFTAVIENEVGSLTSEPVIVEIDTLGPNTPLLDLLPSSDTGHSLTDNITQTTTPEFSFATIDPNQGSHVNAFNYKYRLYVRLDSGAEELVYESAGDATIPDSETDGMFTSLENLSRSISRSVPDGVHNFKLEVEDRAGNISEDFLLDVHVDTQLLGRTDLDLLEASDSGMDMGDGVTKLTQPTFTGLAEVGAEVTLFADGELVGRTTIGRDQLSTVDDQSVWSITTAPLTDGIHLIEARIEDWAGNFLQTNTTTIEIDTEAPNTPFLDLDVVSDDGVSGQDNITSRDDLLFNMTTTDPGQAEHIFQNNYKYRLYLRTGNQVEELVYDSSADESLSLSAGLTDLEVLQTTLNDLPQGTHNFKLEVEDRAGNISHDTFLEVTIGREVLVDVQVPTTIQLVPSSDAGMNPTDGVTNVNAPSFSGLGEAGGTVQLFTNPGRVLVGTGVVGGDLTDGVEGDGIGLWQVTSGVLKDGVYEVLATIEDTAGNLTTSESVQIEIDTLQPNTPLLDLLTDSGHSNNDNITNSSNPEFNMVTVDPNGVSHLDPLNFKYRLYVRLDSGAENLVYNSVGDDLIPGSATDGVFTSLQNLRRTIEVGIPDGTHNFKLEVEDRAGNISEDYLLDVTIDTELVLPDNGVEVDLISAADTGMDNRDNVTKINRPAFAGVAEVGAEVSLFAGGVLVGTTTVGSDESDFNPENGLGAWEITSEPLADGQHEMLVLVEDWAGNFQRSDTLPIDIDTEAPNTPFLDLVGGNPVNLGVETTVSSSLAFTMTTEDANPTQRANPFNYKFRIFLRAAGEAERLVYSSVTDTDIPPENISGGFTNLTRLQTIIDQLSDGEHNFKLEVEDRAGNISHDYLLSVIIGGSVDDPTIDLIPSSDSGMSDSDNVTRLDQPAFNGLGTVGASVRLIANDVIVGTGVVQGDASDGILGNGLGAWEITSEPLDDGTYTILAEIEDDFAQVARSEQLTFEIDTLAPNTPLLDLLPTSDTGLSQSDNVTSMIVPTFNMATQDPNQSEHLISHNYKYRLFVREDSGVELLVYDSVQDNSFPPSATAGGFTSLENLRRAIQLGVPDGVHNFKLEVEDRAGNISEDFLLDVRIDTVLDAPDLGIQIDLLTSSDSGMSERDDVTNKMQPAFSGVAEVGAMINIFANGQPVGTGVVGSDETDFNPGDGLGIWEVTVEPLTDGVYSFLAHVEDLAGNFQRSEQLDVEIDTAAPNTPHLDLVNDTGHSRHDNITEDNILMLHMTSEDPELIGRRSEFNYKYRIYSRLEGEQETLLYNSVTDAGLAANAISEGFTNLRQITTAVGPLPDGIHNLKLEVEDRAGNVSHDFLLTVEIDTVDPNSELTIDLLTASDSGMSNVDNVTNVREPAFQGVGEVGSEVHLYADGELVGRTTVGSDLTDRLPGDGRGAWEITSEPLVDGIHTFVAQMEDWAGNVNSSPELAVEIDTNAPNTPYLDLISDSDSGIGGRDEVTRINTLTFNMTTTDVAQDHLIAQNFKFRLYVRPENGAEEIVYNSVNDTDIPAGNAADGLTDLNFLQRTLAQLPDGVHNFKLEVEDRAGNISEDFLLTVEIDTNLAAPTIDLVPSSDTGMSDTDNVTNKDRPAFSGTGEVGNRVSLYANGLLIGTGFVGSDLTDFVDEPNGQGAWAVTSQPLADGSYTIEALIEDSAGNSQRTAPLTIEVDTRVPNTPHLDLLTSSDTGHSTHDNITGDTTPTVTMTTEDPGQADRENKFNYKYRLYLRSENEAERLVYNSVTDALIPPENLDGSFTDLELLQRELGPLVDGIYNFKLEVEDRAGNISHDVTMNVEIDSTLPNTGVLDLIDSSDSGMSNSDNVTSKDQPAFAGVGTPGTLVRLFANDGLVGSAEVGSDASDGEIGNGLGIWEITSEPLVDNVYAVRATFEDWAGNISDSAALMIEVDTIAPNTPFLDLLEEDDSGRHNDDNITNAEELNFSATTEDSNPANHQVLFPGGQNFKYRLFVRPESGQEVLIYDSSTEGTFEDVVDGLIADHLIVTGGITLSEGLHNLKLEVEDRAGNVSHDFLMPVLVDRTPFVGTGELHPGNDTGIWGIDSTFGDGITGNSTPSFFGTAEANSLVTILVDGNAVVTTVALPFDGDDALQPPNAPYETVLGNWTIDSPVSLSGESHTIEFVFEDPAGNRATSTVSDSSMSLVIDTVGPRIDNVTRADAGFTSLFDPKPAGGPDPLISSIVVHFEDGPQRSEDVRYPAVLAQLALEEGNYRLVGDANGNIPIVGVQILDETTVGPVATTAVQLTFASPLPDDRFTFTVFDRIADAAGNPLDGESGAAAPFEGNHGLNATSPIFPTGDGNHGADFVARFTIDSRPEIGVWAGGSVWTDTNGNFTFDPNNIDFVNRDIVYKIGFTSDDIFAGNFSDGETDGYDKLAAYGAVDWQYRWLVDVDNDGVVDIDVDDPKNVNGVPIAGRFDGDDANGDEVGLYTGSVWHLDTNHDFMVDLELPSNLKGYPVVGDFDGDGFDDLASWADDEFMVDIANETRNGWDGKADFSFRFGFIGVRERPIAADMDQDGIDDLGLWVPDREGVTDRDISEWYWILSGGESLFNRIDSAEDPVRGQREIDFRPRPFGNDIFAQFGDEFSLPVVGNFDPPTVGSLVVESSRAFTNKREPLDVNDDGHITPIDALLGINYLNSHGSSRVDALPLDAMYMDTNGDGYVSPADVLGVVNRLNQMSAQRAAGEPTLFGSSIEAIARDVASALAKSDEADDIFGKN